MKESCQYCGGTGRQYYLQMPDGQKITNNEPEYWQHVMSATRPAQGTPGKPIVKLTYCFCIIGKRVKVASIQSREANKQKYIDNASDVYQR